MTATATALKGEAITFKKVVDFIESFGLKANQVQSIVIEDYNVRFHITRSGAFADMGDGGYVSEVKFPFLPHPHGSRRVL